MQVMNFTDAYHMLGDIWRLYKKYAARKLTDDEIALFTQEAQKVYEKYKTVFAKDVVLAVIGEIGRTASWYAKGE